MPLFIPTSIHTTAIPFSTSLQSFAVISFYNPYDLIFFPNHQPSLRVELPHVYPSRPPCCRGCLNCFANLGSTVTSCFMDPHLKPFVSMCTKCTQRKLGCSAYATPPLVPPLRACLHATTFAHSASHEFGDFLPPVSRRLTPLEPCCHGHSMQCRRG